MADRDSKEQNTTQGVQAQAGTAGGAGNAGTIGKKQLLQLSPSPHIVTPVCSATLMRNMIIALSPAAVFGCIIFGIPALLTIAVSVVSAVIAEAVFRRIIKRESRVKDLSAAVTGLLLALVLPPTTPPWMTALGAIFAIVVVKEFFGGIGSNVFNPALAGRAFLLMSFPAAITEWAKPDGFAVSLTDVVTAATPLAIIKQGGTVAGADYASALTALFTGNHGGSTGETSALLILAGAAYLLVTNTIDWRAPLAMIAAVVIGSLALPGLDPLPGVLSGGVLFGAVFMATDYTTAPLTAKGKLLFGAGAGLITVLIRAWGAFPEGVTYGILIMNACTPFLNKLLPRKYGYVHKKSDTEAKP
jgi:electron transport complex protein RnfD